MASVMGGIAIGGVVALVEKLGLPQGVPTVPTTSSTQPVQTTNQSTATSLQSGSAASQPGQPPPSTTSSTSQSTTRQGVPSGYILLAPLSAVNGKSFAYFNHPSYGSSILIDYNGTWKAFSAICTHAGCTVNFTSSSLYCPCHAGYFSPTNGSVTGGPPPKPLPEYSVIVVNNNLYVSDYVIN